jgi:glycosyltransferase involved in cell wall biosynthesis
MDRFAAFHRGSARRRVERAEAEIARRADVVFATSQGLRRRLAAHRAAVHLLPNGVDAERFCVADRAAAPAQIARLPRPVLGYFGTLGAWVDFDLVGRLASQRPEWSFVFVGPGRPSSAARLGAFPNVQFLGPVPYDELPRYAAGFDVGLIPFKLNELTWHVHPIKALEYLAAGLPAVSTPLPDLEGLAGHVRFATTPFKWLVAIEECLHPDASSLECVQARRAMVQGRSWQVVAESALDAIAREAPRGKLLPAADLAGSSGADSRRAA